MPLLRIQVTLGAGATQLTTDDVPARQIIAEADDGNANPAFMGDSGVTAANGILLTNSATVPGRAVLGPFSGAPVNANEVWFIGTAAQIVNVLVVTH